MILDAPLFQSIRELVCDINSLWQSLRMLHALDLEKRILEQLYREYQNILWQHRVSLRAAALELCDSVTVWGRWDGVTRTIALSRRLILNHEWFHVQSILRHEMAHQMAEECLGSLRMGEGPHGSAFLLACDRLGVPDSFKKASIELQETPLDWKCEPQDGELEKLLSKVQKLLALGTSSNEHEALLAMNKVRELYAKYNLSRASVTPVQQFVHAVICHKKQRLETHQKRIVSILVEYFFVEAITFGMFDPRSGKEHRAIELIGTRENVLMAEYVYSFLLQQSEYWVGESAAASGKPMSRVRRKSFRLGLLEGFAVKLKQDVVPIGFGASVSEQKSLMQSAAAHSNKNKQLQKYLNRAYPRLSRGSNGGHAIDSEAFRAGQVVGQKITLKKPISHAVGPSGLRLE